MTITTSAPRLAWTWLFLLATPLVSGCGSSAEDEAAQACEDMADALVGSAVSCGFAYQPNYDAFVANAAGGDCDNIIKVRDKAALYDECIPFLSKLTCTQVNDSNLQLPDACRAQLER